MPHTIVCSVGTSAAKNVQREVPLAAWVDQHVDPQHAADDIFASFAAVPPEGNALQETLSAEIHSLVRIGITPADRVLLLASETDDGRACALAVKRYLEEHYNGIAAEVETITGLQVTDALRFRRVGVVNFVRACLKAVNDYGPEQVVLNPTGGFKALVPYTVLVGMLKRVACRYIFEQSTALLDLPPLPVTVDRGPFERYRALFERMEHETAIPSDDWNQEVTYEHRVLLAPLVEEVNNEVTLSAVGLLLLDEVRRPAALVPFLCRRAWNDCLDNLVQLPNCDPFRFLARVAGDQNAFRRAEHINMGNGLRWLKPGNTTDRYLVSIEDWRLLVWRAIREDQVGANYPNVVEVDPPNDRQRFAPFTRMEFDRPLGE